MKIRILLAAFAALCLTACTELGPQITPSGESRVLIEEFTGVHCVNCPEGSKKIEELLEVHGDKLIAVSIHAGFFADPYPQSAHDFRTAEGAELDALLGPAAGWPTASVNRKVFPSESTILINKDKWAGYISSEKQQTPKVLLDLTKEYDASSRLLEVSAELRFNERVDDAINVSVMVTEDGIPDPQLTPDNGVVPDYNHRHVLRGMLTPYNGSPYTGSSAVGSSGTMDFNMTLPDGWNADKCHVIAFVSLSGPSAKDVLQVTEVDVVE